MAQNIEENFKLRKYSGIKPKIIAIGSSTGGPVALMTLIEKLAPVNQRIPILITQHIKNGFAQMLVEQITKRCNVECILARPDTIVKPGKIYLAPEDRHMLIDREMHDIIIRVNKARKVNYHRPSVDLLFKSVVKVFGGRTLAIILTGIGNDGLAGAKKIAEVNGTVIVQDKETSVVWGMPGSVAKEGIANAILPIGDIANKIKNIIYS